MEEADLCIRFHRLGRTRLVNRVVITSDRRVAAWGALRANWIYLKVGARWGQRAGAALPRRALNRSPAQIACGDAVVDQPLQEPERCGSPFLFGRVKKLPWLLSGGRVMGVGTLAELTAAARLPIDTGLEEVFLALT